MGRETLPGSDQKLNERVTALQAVVAYLREHGAATPTDFQTDVYPDHPARYTSAENPAWSWWKNAMYPALGAVAEQTGEIESANESGEWRYVGDTDQDQD